MTSLIEDFTKRQPVAQFLMLSAVCWPLIALSIWRDVAIESWPMTLRGVPFQVDFANLWLGAKAGSSGDFANLFDAGRHAARAGEAFGAIDGLMVWSYPPTAILLLLPFSALTSYAVACSVWTLLGIGLYIAALAHGRTVSIKLMGVAAAIAFVPGVFVALSYGQTAFLTSAALFFGITFAASRPMLAALIIAALACKPQLALAAAPALATRGAWRAFVATGLAVLVFLAATVVVLGTEPWLLFFAKTLPQQAQFLRDQTVPPCLQMSAYYMATAFGLPGGVVQVVVTLSVAAMMCHVLRREADADIRFLAIALATLNMSPYLQSYETPLLALAIGRIVLSEQAVARLGRNSVAVLIALATLGMALTAGILSRTGVNVSPVLLLSMFYPLMALHVRALAPRRTWYGRPERA